MIAIVDYGAGNLVSVKKAFDHLCHECVITSDPKQVAEASKIVLPGVGHFAATESLTRSGLRDAIKAAIDRTVPFLGICVGMQWMFDSSEEAPGVDSTFMTRRGAAHSAADRFGLRRPRVLVTLSPEPCAHAGKILEDHKIRPS